MINKNITTHAAPTTATKPTTKQVVPLCPLPYPPNLPPSFLILPKFPSSFPWALSTTSRSAAREEERERELRRSWEDMEVSWVRREDWREAWWSRRWELVVDGASGKEGEGEGRREEVEGRREEGPRCRREEEGTGRRRSGRGVEAGGGEEVGRREERGSENSGGGGVGRAGGGGRDGGEGIDSGWTGIV